VSQDSHVIWTNDYVATFGVGHHLLRTSPAVSTGVSAVSAEYKSTCPTVNESCYPLGTIRALREFSPFCGSRDRVKSCVSGILSLNNPHTIEI
jgi:hypothetical protein